MKLKNHYKMGLLIYAELTRNRVGLPEFPFLFGSLAPDICASFVFRPHKRVRQGRRVEKLLRRLFAGKSCPRGALFSFQLGLLGHYICDFMCYAHTPAFRGDLMEHIRYEDNQVVSAEELLPFPSEAKSGLGAEDMMRTLERYIADHERLLTENGGMSYTDVPVAMYVATWAASCIVASRKKAAGCGSPALRDEAAPQLGPQKETPVSTNF